MKAIVEMAEPTDNVDLRRFLGMINQLMKFCPNLAEMTHPLKKKNAWLCGQTQQQAFKDLKCMTPRKKQLSRRTPAVSVLELCYYNDSLGAVLLQRQSWSCVTTTTVFKGDATRCICKQVSARDRMSLRTDRKRGISNHMGTRTLV